eukprot:5285337-Pyramimonas_sp.AAC.1
MIGRLAVFGASTTVIMGLWAALLMLAAEGHTAYDVTLTFLQASARSLICLPYGPPGTLSTPTIAPVSRLQRVKSATSQHALQGLIE